MILAIFETAEITYKRISLSIGLNWRLYHIWFPRFTLLNSLLRAYLCFNEHSGNFGVLSDLNIMKFQLGCFFTLNVCEFDKQFLLTLEIFASSQFYRFCHLFLSPAFFLSWPKYGQATILSIRTILIDHKDQLGIFSICNLM